MPGVFDGVTWTRRTADFKGTTRYGRAFAPPKWHIIREREDHPNGNIISLCGYAVLDSLLDPAKRRKTPPQAGDRCVQCLKKHLKALEQLPAEGERIEA